MKLRHRALPLALLALASMGTAEAQVDAAERLLQLARIPGVSGHESDVRKAVASMIPSGFHSETDGLGNLIVRIGSGSPRTLVVAPLDEPGYVVSAITDEGYLRLHQPTTGLGHRLAHQYHVGQPVLVGTAQRGYVAGVTATPSTHLRSTRPEGTDNSPRSIDDLFVDTGASSRDEVAAQGIRLLDPVTLRERAARLGGTELAGVAVSARAGAVAMLGALHRLQGTLPSGSVTFAFAVQSFFGQRGLLRLVETEKPDRLIAFTGALPPREDPLGSTGVLGSGPLVRDNDPALADEATAIGVSIQKRPASELPLRGLGKIPSRVLAWPTRYAQTPVEVVDARDLEAASRLLLRLIGVDSGALTAGASVVAPPPPPPVTFVEPDLRILAGLIREFGVSTHEGPVRERVRRLLPAWARPEVDEKGNLIVRFGHGGKPLVFVAHTDEVGFEIVAINDDGTASIRPQGGMYVSLYEAHPVLVHTGNGAVEAVLAPRRGYATADALEPQVSDLRLDVGASNRNEAEALGLRVGQSITPRKDLWRLGENRAAARAMDDRNGSTALLLALARLDPETVRNQVTFVWSVEEEIGLFGAGFLAASEKPDTVFAVDTFVSSDSPVDSRRLAYAPLGAGAVLRGLDNRTLVPADVMDRIAALAAKNRILLQIGVTGGGTDASPFSAGGATDVGLSWPGRYSHSPVEVMDRRDLESLVRLIVVLAREY